MQTMSKFTIISKTTMLNLVVDKLGLMAYVCKCVTGIREYPVTGLAYLR
jgi:hypothetical protein